MAVRGRSLERKATVFAAVAGLEEHFNDLHMAVLGRSYQRMSVG
jgi:hypothetical protein